MEFVLFIVIVSIIAWSMWDNAIKKQNELSRLKQNYKDALNSYDKAKALQAGRSYYSYLRGGKLTIYDEQAITNDLMTM